MNTLLLTDLFNQQPSTSSINDETTSSSTSVPSTGTSTPSSTESCPDSCSASSTDYSIKTGMLSDISISRTSKKSKLTHFSWNCIGIRLLLMTTIFSFLFLPSISSSPPPEFSPQQRHLIRKVILKKLGLEEMNESREQREQTNSRSPMPLYIWDFYEQANQGDIELLRHYLPRQVTTSTSNSDDRNDGWFIVYNLTATGRRKDKELIVKADIRIRLGSEMPTAEEFHQQEIIHDYEEDEPALLTTTWENLNIYEVDRENRENHRLLDTRFLPSESLRRGDKWVDFDVTPALTRRRKEDSNDLIEFYIKRLVSNNNTPMSIDLRDSAALIVQIETPETANQNRRRKRSTKKNKNRRRKQHHGQPKAKNLCRLESLWVDFKQLDWDDWIISPAAYDAYQCRGKCIDAPPSARQNYSNHAIMQTLIHSLNASAVPPPCCVPTEMSPLPILYRDVHNTTIVHKYPDMIVEACGCH